MSSNQISQARSMNGVLDFDGVENLNVDNIDAINIDVENLEIETNLKVNNIDISPEELSFLNNTTSNIQQQINNITNITDDAVTITGDQTISGNKTFSGTTTLTGDLNVNSTNISPTELSYLDGLQDNIQTQLDNAGISNSVTLNTDQVITSAKTFTQPVGLPSVIRDDNTGTFTGFMSSTGILTYSNLTGSFSVANSTIVGEGVNSTIVSATTRTGTSGGELVLQSGSPTAPVVSSVDGYLSTTVDVAGRDYVFENVSNIQGLSGSTFFTGIKWNTTSSVTIPAYIDDFVLSKSGYSIRMVSNSDITISPNETAQKGYILNSNTFILKPYDPVIPVPTLTIGDFIEGTGFTPPCKITAVDDFSYTITSPNVITPTTTVRTSVTGYIDNVNAQGYSTIYYSSSAVNVIVNYQSFVKGICSPQSMIQSAGTINKTINLRYNSVVSTPDYTKYGYIKDANNIVFDNLNDLQLNKFVKNSNIPLGKHYITAIANDLVTLGEITMTVPSSTSHDGYLYSNNILVGTGYTLDNYITHPTDIPDLRTKISVINPTFVNLSSSNNTPTPNNKTYNGFSPSSTKFYYNNDSTSVAINYYLKDNNILAPTTNHLITQVDTTYKILTTANLPVATPTYSVNGYTNTNLNKIVLSSSGLSISVGDGIDTTLINNSTRFVSSVNSASSGIEVGVSGTLNSITHPADLTGFVSTSSSVIAYDPNTRLAVNNFLVDYDTVPNIPNNTIITSITSLGSDIYEVGVSSSTTTITPSNFFNRTPSYKTAGNKLVYGGLTGRSDTVYSQNSNYRYIISENNYEYTTNDTGTSSFFQTINGMNIKMENGDHYFLFGLTNGSGFNKVYKLLQNSTYVPYATIPTLTGSIQNSTIQNAMEINNIFNETASYTPYNYGYLNINTNVEDGGNAMIIIKDGYLYFLKNSGITAISNGSFIIDTTGRNMGTDLLAVDSKNTGLTINTSVSGNMPHINYYGTNIPNTETESSASSSAFTLAIDYNTTTTQIKVYHATILPYNFYFHKIVATGIGYKLYVTSRVINGDGTQTLNLNTSAPFGKAGEIWYVTDFVYTTNLFQYALLQPSNFNTYTNTGIIREADNNASYKSLPPTNVNIYSSSNFDSYNSYAKTTFQEITEINFEIFDGTTFEEIEQIDYDTFEKLNFSVYTLENYIAQTSYNVTFPTNTNNEVFVLQDVFQILTNKYIRDLTVLDEIRLGDIMRVPETGLEIFSLPVGSTDKIMEINTTQVRTLKNLVCSANATFNSSTTFNSTAVFNSTTTLNNTLTVNSYSYFNNSIRSHNQPVWYLTSGSGYNQYYGAGGRIGSSGYTGGYTLTRYFNNGISYNASNTYPYDAHYGAFYSHEGAGIYLVELFLFNNNAQGFNGRISMQTNAGRSQGGQYNFNVNRYTSTETCTNLTWVWTCSQGQYFYFYIHSSVLVAYIAQGHTGLRVTKIM